MVDGRWLHQGGIGRFVYLNEGLGIRTSRLCYPNSGGHIQLERHSKDCRGRALLVDPMSVEEVSRVLRLAAAGGETIERLRLRGVAIARKYSWEKPAGSFWSEAAFLP